MVREIRKVRRKKEIGLNKKEAAIWLPLFCLFKKSGGKESGLNSFGPRTKFLRTNFTKS